MGVTDIVVFDKDNKQDEYQFMARSVETGKLVIGWIVIEQPWYSHPRNWSHYIYRNDYGGSGFCGGASDLGLKRENVDPETIEVYNQTSAIKYNQEIGFNTKLIKEFDTFDDIKDNVVCIICPDDEIPYGLWE